MINKALFGLSQSNSDMLFPDWNSLIANVTISSKNQTYTIPKDCFLTGNTSVSWSESSSSDSGSSSSSYYYSGKLRCNGQNLEVTGIYLKAGDVLSPTGDINSQHCYRLKIYALRK